MKNAEIMNRAHELTRAAIAEFPRADYRATFRAALAIAWSESRACDAIRAEWESMDGNAQYSALVRMTWACVETRKAETNARGQYRPNYFNCVSSTDDAQTVAGEAWAIMSELIDTAPKDADGAPLPLSILLARACEKAARRIHAAERKHANACRSSTATDADGNSVEREYIDTTSPTGERIAPSPFEYAALSESINAACKDSTDALIMKCAIYGLTQTETAELVGMSQRAVSKRLQKMRERYYDAI